MIKIKIDDTIVDIVEKIESQPTWDIVLDFPLWHPILHNYISLKILKSKVWERKLVITSNDRIWKKIWTQLWIEYSVIRDDRFYEHDTRNKLMEHNFTFWEYFKFQIASYISEIWSIIHTNKRLNSLTKYRQKYNNNSSVWIFLLALIFSIILFLFIYYFAISKSYIFITPEIVVKKEAHNFVFNENSENSILWNNKNIKISKISKTIHLEEKYSSTAIKNNIHDKSQWKIKIFNTLDEIQTLIPNTRFQTKEWIIFQIEDWVKIPAAVTDNFWKISPGIIEAKAIAKTKDANGSFIGTSWNIKKGTSLILPWLPESLQTSIYAESIEDFSGWNDTFEKMVSQKDIDNAFILFEEKLKNDAITLLKNSISIENNRNNTKIDILSWAKSMYYSDLDMNLESGIKDWSLQENFTLSWSVSITAYTFNKESIIQKLKTLINEKKIDGIEKISHIDTSSLRMSETIYTQEKPFEMKATFEIEALFLHDFLHTENTYVELLKSKIRWIEISEAEKILLNDPRISNVEVRVRPFFMNNISNIYNNIIFKVK